MAALCNGDVISRLVTSLPDSCHGGRGVLSRYGNLFSTLFLIVKACGLLGAFVMNSRTQSWQMPTIIRSNGRTIIAVHKIYVTIDLDGGDLWWSWVVGVFLGRRWS